MAGQNKSTLRNRMRSALAHKSLADALLDGLKLTQDKMNASLDKLDADTDIALDVNYVASGAITGDDLIDADAPKNPAQHDRTLRKSLQSALAHRSLANEILDSMQELQVAYNALLVKLDAEAGTLNDINYVSSLGLSIIDADGYLAPAQHQQSLRKSLQSALANKSLADQFLDGIKNLQDAFNAALVKLDAATINGQMAALKVSPIDPESRD